MKTVSSLDAGGGVLNFDGLDHRQFNKLAGPDFLVPRYLFVVHVPRTASKYVDLRTSGLLLRHIGYYLSLRDREPMPSDDRARHTRVKIPLSNVLTAASLRALVSAAGS